MSRMTSRTLLAAVSLAALAHTEGAGGGSLGGLHLFCI